MQLLFVLALAAIGLINGQLVGNVSAPIAATNITACHSMMDLKHSDLRQFVECLSRTTNLTYLTADTMVRLELVSQNLNKWKTIQSPFWHIDDVLKIDRSTIASLDCQARLHVMYGLRRKLAQLQLMHGVDTGILEISPMAGKPESVIKIPPKEPIKSLIVCDNCAKPEDIEELTCLIGSAARRERHKTISTKKTNK